MPGKFKLTYRIPDLNPGQVVASLHKRFEVLLRKAVREWLRAAITTVPTYTGTARGTLRPLGRFLNVAVPIGKRSSDRRAQAATHTVQGSVYQLGPQAGEDYSNYELETSPGKYLFQFHQQLPWAVWNAFGQPVANVASAPWFTYDVAREAFVKFVEDNIQKEVPKTFQETLKVRTISD